MRSIRGGGGLGDALYVQSVARHLIERGESLTICSDWPDVFKFLDAEVVPFRRNNVDIVAHYSMRKRVRATDQFMDCCIQAGIDEPVDMRLDWEIQNTELTDSLRSHGKPVLLVQMARPPMDRDDGFSDDMIPDWSVIQKCIDVLKSDALVVQIGAGDPMYQYSGIDIDLANKTTVSDLIDVASMADGFLGPCSNVIPFAEAFSKPAMLVWSRKGLSSKEPYIRTITPQKILHRRSCGYVFDDWAEERITESLNDFFNPRSVAPYLPWPERGDSGERARLSAKRSRFRRRSRHRS